MLSRHPYSLSAFAIPTTSIFPPTCHIFSSGTPALQLLVSPLSVAHFTLSLYEALERKHIFSCRPSEPSLTFQTTSWELSFHTQMTQLFALLKEEEKKFSPKSNVIKTFGITQFFSDHKSLDFYLRNSRISSRNVLFYSIK